MPKYTSNSITVIDSLDNINLELFVSSNLPTIQILNNGTYSPSWVTTPLVLTPSVYVKNKLVTNPVISWQRRTGGYAYTSLIAGESVTNGILTVNKNLLANDENKIITYKCTVTYGEITHSIEKTFSLNVVGKDGKDGSSVSIKGTAYTTETSYVIGEKYTLYSDSEKTTQITSAENGDAYLVGGYLFVYGGDTDDKFAYVGDVKGVGISSITGPTSNGLIDTYVIHYTDGSFSTYQVKNGANAKTLDLHASKYAVAYDSLGNLKDDSDIILTANQQYINTPLTWTISEGAALNGLGNIRTLDANIFNYKNSVQISISAEGLSDTVTIVKIQDGSEGAKGQSVFVTYNDSEAIPVAPTGNGISNGWHTNMTDTSIWMSQKTALNISSGTWGAPVRIKGVDGKGISNVSITYQVSSSGSSIPTGGWVSTLPAVTSGKYLWTRSVTTYSDNTTSTAYSVGGVGTNGSNGRGISTTTITYQAGTSGTVAPTGTWSANIPSVAANQYLWTKTTITYTDDTTTTSYSIGKMGYSGIDGYTITLSNESHTFAGSTSAALEGSTTCDVIAYKGATQIAATIGTITGMPTGMTAVPVNNGTINAGFTVTVAGNMTTTNGSLTVPITIDGKTFNKVFTYAVSLAGEAGTSGVDAVTFKVYSANGYILSINNPTISLQTFSYVGNVAITAGATYQWYKSDGTSWVIIDGAINPYFDITREDISFTNSYMCKMIFRDTEYQDVVTIEDKSDGHQLFTSKPTSYMAGDIWLVGTDYTPPGVEPKTMLRAEHSNTSYNDNDWILATKYDEQISALQQNIDKYNQYFTFDATEGLKITARDNNGNVSQFSTSLSNERLSFNQGSEAVAYIESHKMKIKEAEIVSPLTITGQYSGNTMQQAPVLNIGNFSLIVESNGSFSIVANT